MHNETTAHYDADVDFYSQFLDPYMKYTSGLYTAAADTFESAIVKMLDRHVAVAASYAAPRVLEIGPGWGALLRRLGETRGALDYTAVNPSRSQNAFIHRHVRGDATLLEGTFEARAPDLRGPFDVIYLVGSYCHMRDKGRQLERLAGLLAPEGTMVFEDTFFLSDEIRRAHGARPETRYVQETVFGFAEITSLAEFVNDLAARRLLATELLDHSTSYARTIETWMARIARLDPARFPRTEAYRRYMSIFQRGWGRTIANYIVHVRHAPRRGAVTEPQAGTPA